MSVGGVTIFHVETEAELRWAIEYDGYKRIASSPELLAEVLRPAMDEFERTGRVPAWCGVDLLRAWAFYRQREHHHDGLSPMAQDFQPVLEAIRRHPDAKAEDMPPSRHAALPEDWRTQLRSTLAAPYWTELMTFVANERHAHAVFPDEPLTFRAFDLTPFDDVRVVILGQDPYPTPGDADGLAFSTAAAKTPDSLANIFKELASDLGISMPSGNRLDGWAQQGVLLLNTALTLRAGTEADRAVHRKWRWEKQGWNTFTDAVITTVSAKQDPVVFIFWGGDAREKQALVDTDRHLLLEAAHPSRKSASKGFFDSRPFSKTNAFLEASGRGRINWAKTEA